MCNIPTTYQFICWNTICHYTSNYKPLCCSKASLKCDLINYFKLNFVLQWYCTPMTLHSNDIALQWHCYPMILHSNDFKNEDSKRGYYKMLPQHCCVRYLRLLDYEFLLEVEAEFKINFLLTIPFLMFPNYMWGERHHIYGNWEYISWCSNIHTTSHEAFN